MANKNAIIPWPSGVHAGYSCVLLDEPRYAQRAGRVIRTWFVDPKTRMNPSLDYAQAVRNINSGRGAGVLDGRF